jgi:hypothetical protein
MTLDSRHHADLLAEQLWIQYCAAVGMAQSTGNCAAATDAWRQFCAAFVPGFAAPTPRLLEGVAMRASLQHARLLAPEPGGAK